VAYMKVMSRHLPGKTEGNHESTKIRTANILDATRTGQLSRTCEHYRLKQFHHFLTFDMNWKYMNRNTEHVSPDRDLRRSVMMVVGSGVMKSGTAKTGAVRILR
jgi:hypothetical protein